MVLIGLHGLLLLVSPQTYWKWTRFTRSWMYADGTDNRDPSHWYLWIARVSGIAFIASAVVFGFWHVDWKHQQQAKQKAAEVQEEIEKYLLHQWGVYGPYRVVTSADVSEQVDPANREPERVIGYSAIEDQERTLLENSDWFPGSTRSFTPVEGEAIDGKQLLVAVSLSGCVFQGIEVTETAGQVIVDFGFTESQSNKAVATAKPAKCTAPNRGSSMPSFIPLDLQQPLGQRSVVFPDGTELKKKS